MGLLKSLDANVLRVPAPRNRIEQSRKATSRLGVGLYSEGTHAYAPQKPTAYANAGRFLSLSVRHSTHGLLHPAFPNGTSVRHK